MPSRSAFYSFCVRYLLSFSSTFNLTLLRFLSYSELNVYYSQGTDSAPKIVWEIALVDLVFTIAGVSTVDQAEGERIFMLKPLSSTKTQLDI